MSIQKNISSTLIYQIGIAVANFCSILLITRLLGAQGRGQIAIYNNAVAVATTIFSFSLGSAIVYFVAGKKINVQDVFTIMLYTLVGVFLLLCILIFCFYYFHQLQFITPFNNSFLILFLFVLHVSVTIFNIWISALLNAKKIFVLPLVIQFVYFFIVVIGLLLFKFQLLTFAFLSVTNVVIAMVVLYCICNIVLFILAIKLLQAKVFFFKINSSIIHLFWQFSFWSFLCNTVQMLCYRLDVWYLQYYHTETLVGIYSISVLCVQLLWILPNQISNVLYTSFNSNQNKKIVINYVVKICRISFFTFAILYCIAWICSYIGLPLLFGKQFIQSAPLLGILLIGAIPLAATMVISTYNASANKLKTNLKGSILGLLVCLILNPILISKYNFYGAAIASALSYLINSVYLYLEFCISHQQSLFTIFKFNKTEIVSFYKDWHNVDANH